MPTHSAGPDCFGVLRGPPGVAARLAVDDEGEVVSEIACQKTEMD